MNLTGDGKMRIIALALIAATLIPASAHARRPQPVATPVALEDISLAQDAPAVERVVTSDEYARASTRLALDVRYGPADSTVRHGDAVVSTWRVDAAGRDRSMRRAGIGRITVVQVAGSVRISLLPIAQVAEPVIMASAN
jgi:hypothetical protein